MEAIQALVELIRAIGHRHGATPAQIAFARLYAQKPWIVPLFGTPKLERFEETIGAFNVTLTESDLHEIANADIALKAARYSDERTQRVRL